MCSFSSRARITASIAVRVDSSESGHTCVYPAPAPQARRVALESVSAKVRAGGPDDDADDEDLSWWAGVIPVRTVHGAPQPADYTGTEPAPGPDPRFR